MEKDPTLGEPVVKEANDDDKKKNAEVASNIKLLLAEIDGGVGFERGTVWLVDNVRGKLWAVGASQLGNTTFSIGLKTGLAGAAATVCRATPADAPDGAAASLPARVAHCQAARATASRAAPAVGLLRQCVAQEAQAEGGVAGQLLFIALAAVRYITEPDLVPRPCIMRGCRYRCARPSSARGAGRRAAR